MVDRFRDLHEELLRAGVAPRYIRRAVMEIAAHFAQLIEEELGRGASEPDARREAHRRLGANEVLVRSYAERPELQAWSRRWPAIWFTAVALASYLVLSAASMAILGLACELMKDYLHRVHIAPEVTFRIDLAARILFLWLYPWCVAAVFAVLAYRRRAALHWPVIGIVVLSVLTSLINVTVTLTGGVIPGEFGAGIGISTEVLAEPLMRATILALPPVLGLVLAARQLRRTRTMS
jgi:hypothetical protein